MLFLNVLTPEKLEKVTGSKTSYEYGHARLLGHDCDFSFAEISYYEILDFPMSSQLLDQTFQQRNRIGPMKPEQENVGINNHADSRCLAVPGASSRDEDEFLSKDCKFKQIKAYCAIVSGVSGLQMQWTILVVFFTPMVFRLGGSPELASVCWLFAPTLGLYFSPVVGNRSDRCTSNFGRRRPFLLAIEIVCTVCMSVIPFLLRFKNPGIAVVLLIAAYAIWELGNNLQDQLIRTLATDISKNHTRMYSFVGASVGLGSTLGGFLGAMDYSSFTPLGSLLSNEQFTFILAAGIYTSCSLVMLALAKEVPLIPANGNLKGGITRKQTVLSQDEDTEDTKDCAVSIDAGCPVPGMMKDITVSGRCAAAGTESNKDDKSGNQDGICGEVTIIFEASHDSQGSNEDAQDDTLIMVSDMMVLCRKENNPIINVDTCLPEYVTTSTGDIEDNQRVQQAKLGRSTMDYAGQCLKTANGFLEHCLVSKELSRAPPTLHTSSSILTDDTRKSCDLELSRAPPSLHTSSSILTDDKKEYCDLEQNVSCTISKRGLPLWNLLRRAPRSFSYMCITQLLSQFGLCPVFMYTTSFFAENLYGGDPLAESGTDTSRLYELGLRRGALAFTAMSTITMVASMMVPTFVKYVGLRWTFSGMQLLPAACLFAVFFIQRANLAIVLIGMSGLAWAANHSLSSVYVAHSVSKDEYGLATSTLYVFQSIPAFIVAATYGSIIRATDNNFAVPLLLSALSFMAAGILNLNTPLPPMY